MTTIITREEELLEASRFELDSLAHRPKGPTVGQVCHKEHLRRGARLPFQLALHRLDAKHEPSEQEFP